MILAYLIFVIAFLMEAIGTYISVTGLSLLFARDWVIIGMAVILDAAKLVSVSFLYKHWKSISFSMKSYMTSAVIVLMVITSTGAFGYLSNQFQKAIQPNVEVSMKIETDKKEIDLLEKEKIKLESNKNSFNKQIEQLPQDQVSTRQRLSKTFTPEINRINKRTDEIDLTLLELKQKLRTLESENFAKSSEVGPILYLGKILGLTPEDVSKWIILVLILVFDPLAVCLIMAGNFLLLNKKTDKEDPQNIQQISQKSEETPVDILITENVIKEPITEKVERKKIRLIKKPKLELVSTKKPQASEITESLPVVKKSNEIEPTNSIVTSSIDIKKKDKKDKKHLDKKIDSPSAIDNKNLQFESSLLKLNVSNPEALFDDANYQIPKEGSRAYRIIDFYKNAKTN